MAGIQRVHGGPIAGAFYGLQPLVIKIADSSSGFTADTLDGNGLLTAEGGYSEGIKALQTVGSIVWLGAQANASLCAVVDGATINRGPGSSSTYSGTWGALKEALVGAGFTLGDLTVTSSTTLNGAGTFTFA
jgi:hypothetical protein